MISEKFERLCGPGTITYADDTKEAIAEKIAIDKCKEYSDEPEKIGELLKNELSVSYRWNGIKKHFDSDEKPRQCIVVKIERNGKAIEFDYGLSLNDTDVISGSERRGGGIYVMSLSKRAWKMKELKSGLLYSIIACIRSDYQYSDTFQDFCSEFGYSDDSIQAEKTWIACKEQSRKLQRVMSAEEAEIMPS